MKQSGVWHTVVIIAFLSVGSRLYSIPIPDGAEGYITMPSALVANPGRVATSLRWTAPGQLGAAVNIVPLVGWEFGAGWESSVFSNTTSALADPVQVSTKVAYCKSWGLAAMAETEFPLGTAGTTNWYTITQMVRQELLGFDFTFGIGYTFGSTTATGLIPFGNGLNINFHFGFLRRLLSSRFLLLGDVSNHPYRVTIGADRSFADENRGIVNLGLHVVLTRNTSLEFSGLDLMDLNRRLLIQLTWIPTP